jgi:alkylation response protein AidB-like acyl-CoA dehydrogenase
MMDLELTTEQRELQSLAADLLAQRVPSDLPRAYLEGHGDATELWSDLAELGWYGVGLEEGDGFGVPGLCVLTEQIGRRIAPTVLVDVAVAARIVLAGGADAVRDAWLERLATGATTVALAVLEDGGQWSAGRAETFAVADGSGGYRLSGTKIGVHHGAAVGTFGVLASLAGEPAFFLVAADLPGVEVVAEPGIDPTARAVRLVLSDVAVTADSAIVGVDAAEAIEHAFALGAVATIAEAVGAASAALDLAVAYALERVQFKRPIGSFQSVQHLLADAHVLRESAWSSTLYAAASIDEGMPDAAESSTIAKAYVSRASRKVVELALQVLGGIGFTWEHDLHLFLRRVMACEQRFGDAIYHEQQLGDILAERAVTRRAVITGRSAS